MSDETDEPASRVLFENHQWQVTDYGVESIKPAPTYNFSADRLLETQGAGAGQFYDWPVHMAEKTWVDIEAFIEAFTQAVKPHAGKFKGSVDLAKFSASIAKAREEAPARILHNA
jgi:hypothetical protein